MAHYMRSATDTREITLELLETALQAVDPFYRLPGRSRPCQAHVRRCDLRPNVREPAGG